MIEISKKKQKKYIDVLFYCKDNNALNTLNQNLVKYVETQTKEMKSDGFLEVTDSSDSVKKYLVVYIKDIKKLTMLSFSRLFSKLVKNYKGEFNIDLDNLSNCKLEFNKIVKQLVLDIYYFSYNFDRFKSIKVENNNKYLLVTKENISQVVEDATIIAKAIDNTRDLVNTPVNYLNTYELCDYVTELANGLENVSLEILDEKQCEELKMGGFLGVNKGSLQKARMITLKYQGLETFDNPVGLIGKGVMFDTGGYSIKSNMATMKCDMAGSATVIGVFEAASKLKLPINLIAMVAATDNRINEHAIVVDDVLTSMSGRTIEIGSTDAEGRLTLCDAITYIQTLGCKEIIDMATLTGAVVAALGSYITGVFSNDKKMVNELIKSAKAVDSDFWELPITDHIRETVKKSPVADLINRAAPGASAAAAFLEAFVENGTKWVHVDIAGTAYRTSSSYLEPFGATAVGLKEVLNYLMSK